MSKLSIYENSWLHLVFEGKNKEYGAFQLRQKSDETTLLAFCLGLFFVATVISVSVFVAHLDPKNRPQLEPEVFHFPAIQLSDVHPNKPQAPLKLAVPIAKKRTDEAEKKQLIHPEIVSPKDADQDIASTKEHPKTVDTSTETTTTTGTPSTENSASGTVVKSVIATTTIETINSTSDLDKLPEFPGGMNKFYTYVGENFESLEVEETISVLMSFVIERDGSMTDIKVLRSSSPSIDKEAIRVLKSLRTKWKPGYKDGQPVRTLYKLPIKVKK
jgi:protein TonB